MICTTSYVRTRAAFVLADHESQTAEIGGVPSTVFVEYYFSGLVFHAILRDQLIPASTRAQLSSKADDLSFALETFLSALHTEAAGHRVKEHPRVGPDARYLLYEVGKWLVTSLKSTELCGIARSANHSTRLKFDDVRAETGPFLHLYACFTAEWYHPHVPHPEHTLEQIGQAAWAERKAARATVAAAKAAAAIEAAKAAEAAAAVEAAEAAACDQMAKWGQMPGQDKAAIDGLCTAFEGPMLTTAQPSKGKRPPL
jgi:hypothetical protein